MSWNTGTRRATGTNPRATGTNPRATGSSSRCLGTNPTAGTARDSRRVASTIMQASAVAEHRGDHTPATSRAATMYLAANRMAGGPRPTRQQDGWYWYVGERETARTELAAMFGYAPRATGLLAEATAAELHSELHSDTASTLAEAEAEAEPP